MKQKISVMILGIFMLFSMFGIVSAQGMELDFTVEANGGISVNIQDQTTRPFDIRVNQIINQNIQLASAPVVDTYDLVLVAGHGVTAGDNIAFLEQNGMPQLLFGEVLSVSVNTITLDTLVPYSFIPSNTEVFTYENDISIDGSGTPEVFAITNFFTEAIDITRVIFHCTDQTAMDDAKFCGLSKLDRGLVFRKKLLNGNYINFWNVKTNGEWAELAFDKSYDEKAPAGFYGFATRLTYGGQSKHGVVVRLEPGESIELIVQDNLLGLDSGSLMIEGHFIQS